jgi:hypothetical protein
MPLPALSVDHVDRWMSAHPQIGQNPVMGTQLANPYKGLSDRPEDELQAVAACGPNIGRRTVDPAQTRARRLELYLFIYRPFVPSAGSKEG